MNEMECDEDDGYSNEVSSMVSQSVFSELELDEDFHKLSRKEKRKLIQKAKKKMKKHLRKHEQIIENHIEVVEVE